MSTVALNVSMGRNLSCSYCEQKPSRIASMTVSDCKRLQIACQIDMRLLDAAGNRCVLLCDSQTSFHYNASL